MKWLDKNQNKILIAIWGFIFLTCLVVIFTERVNAESPSGTLPYVVSSNWDANSALHNNFDIALNWARLRYENVDHVPEGYSILIWTNNGAWVDGYGRAWTSYVFCVNPYITDYYSQNFDYTVNTVAIRTDYPIYTYNYVNAGVYNSGAGTSPANLLGSYSLVGTEYALFTPNYPFYYDGEPIKDPNGVTVITNSYSPPIDDTGHAVPPINDEGHYIPNVNPQHPNINPYTPSTPQFPIIDTSSLESLIESLIDVTEYGFNYLGGFISGSVSNLLSNLGSWFDYIVESFRQGFNNIVGAIQDLATDFYNNMASLFENVATFYNSIISLGSIDGKFTISTLVYNLIVPDPDDLASVLVENDEFGVIPLVSALKTQVNSVYNSIFNVSAVKSFNLPSFSAFGTTFPSYQIDFSWYDDYKVYSDVIISGFLIIGYLHWFFITFSSHIRGGSVIAGDVTVPDKKGGH